MEGVGEGAGEDAKGFSMILVCFVTDGGAEDGVFVGGAGEGVREDGVGFSPNDCVFSGDRGAVGAECDSDGVESCGESGGELC